MDRISTSESDSAYAYLHDAIVRGEILPRQRLIELDLAEQLSVGRAAIRTALDRLVHDGLAVHVPHRGAHVRHIPVEEAVEMMETRAVLEGLAARSAAQLATAGDIDELNTILKHMQDRLAENDLTGYSEYNAILHDRIVQLSGNRTVMRLLKKLQASHVRYQYRMVLLPGRAEQSYLEHQAVVDAIAAHEPQLAEEAMKRHLTCSVAELQRRMQLHEVE